MKASDVLSMYQSAEFPEFIDIVLDDVNVMGSDGDRPLHIACRRGVLDEVVALLEAGALVNVHGDIGNTPLHEAASVGNLAIIKALLARGALPGMKNEFGELPWEWARRAGFDDVAKLLRI